MRSRGGAKNYCRDLWGSQNDSKQSAFRGWHSRKAERPLTWWAHQAPKVAYSFSWLFKSIWIVDFCYLCKNNLITHPSLSYHSNLSLQNHKTDFSFKIIFWFIFSHSSFSDYFIFILIFVFGGGWQVLGIELSRPFHLLGTQSLEPYSKSSF
jgi:hypothetical protein